MNVIINTGSFPRRLWSAHGPSLRFTRETMLDIRDMYTYEEAPSNQAVQPTQIRGRKG